MFQPADDGDNLVEAFTMLAAAFFHLIIVLIRSSTRLALAVTDAVSGSTEDTLLVQDEHQQLVIMEPDASEVTSASTPIADVPDATVADQASQQETPAVQELLGSAINRPYRIRSSSPISISSRESTPPPPPSPASSLPSIPVSDPPPYTENNDYGLNLHELTLDDIAIQPDELEDDNPPPQVILPIIPLPEVISDIAESPEGSFMSDDDNNSSDNGSITSLNAELGSPYLNDSSLPDDTMIPPNAGTSGSSRHVHWSASVPSTVETDDADELDDMDDTETVVSDDMETVASDEEEPNMYNDPSVYIAPPTPHAQWWYVVTEGWRIGVYDRWFVLCLLLRLINLINDIFFRLDAHASVYGLTNVFTPKYSSRSDAIEDFEGMYVRGQTKVFVRD